MKYAVVVLQGHQYKVTEGQEVLVDRLVGVIEPKILLVCDEAEVKVGNPTVSGAEVVFSLIGHEKGEKIDVFKYKSKSRYRKKTGFRAFLTKLKVEKISL